MTAIVSVGAYDRFNYGDLLFPRVLDYIASSRGLPDITHLAVVDADLRSQGGSDVHRASTWSAANDIAGLVVGGGEVLSATWTQALVNFAPYPTDLGLRILRKIFGTTVVDAVSRRALRGRWPTPYVPTRGICDRVPVAFNAVGASSFPNLTGRRRAHVIEALKTAAYVSVRDASGLAAVQPYRSDAALAPDSVAILDRILPFKDANDRKTLVFQCSQQWLWDSPTPAAELIDLATDYDELVLLPIGLAGGHNDHLALTTVQKQLEAAGVHPVGLESDATVDSIAQTISRADMFIGTSLHGAITAMAYGIPHVALDQVTKLSEYIDTWGDGLTPNRVPSSSIALAARQAARAPRERLSERSKYLSELAWANTNLVIDAATSSR